MTGETAEYIAHDKERQGMCLWMTEASPLLYLKLAWTYILTKRNQELRKKM
jgi:hypothetical protein